jgi:hypothetical protein
MKSSDMGKECYVQSAPLLIDSKVTNCRYVPVLTVLTALTSTTGFSTILSMNLLVLAMIKRAYELRQLRQNPTSVLPFPFPFRLEEWIPMLFDLRLLVCSNLPTSH